MQSAAFWLLCVVSLISATAGSPFEYFQAATVEGLTSGNAYSIRESTSRRLLATTSLTCVFANAGGKITCNSVDYVYCCETIGSVTNCAYQKGGFPTPGCESFGETSSCCKPTAAGSTGNALTPVSSGGSSGSSGSSSSNFVQNLQSQQSTNAIVNTIAGNSPVNVLASG